jgi:L,D-transpeptidase catalytic domain
VAEVHVRWSASRLATSGLRSARFLLEQRPVFRRVIVALCLFVAPTWHTFGQLSAADRVVVSVRDQKLMLVQDGFAVATYPVSTSRFGLGDGWGSLTTPLGLLQVAQKIGDHAPSGAVFHKRRWTGEILAPNAPGRDPIVSRIIWLRGLEASNAHAFNRCIYIHGTPQEKIIGQPASYGCIRMKSSDVTALYERLPIGALVQIVPDRLPKIAKAPRNFQPANQQPIVSTDAKPAGVSQAKAHSVPLLASSKRGGA